MRHLLALLILPAFGLAQGTVVSLIPPSAPIASSAVVRIDLLAVNPSASVANFSAPDQLVGKVHVDSRSWPVELAAESPVATIIPAGGFSYRTYAFKLPPGVTGSRVVVELSPSTAASQLRAVLNVTASQPAVAEPATLLSPLRGSVPAVAQIHRSFMDRFAEHDSVYFIYGPDAPVAKFQFSFKYRLINLGEPGGEDLHRRTLQFGYTQRSLWDIENESSPFYDTSYIPSLFFESLASSDHDGGWFTWLGWQGGYQHESNGRDGVDSRSLDTLFVRPGLAIGPLDGWHLIFSPRFWSYIGGLDDNSRIKDYRGYAEWMVTIGKNDGPSLTYTGWAGKGFDHFTTQLDLTIPLRFKVVDFATFLLIQYYNGYGESLLDYDRRSETVRAGISLVN